MNAAGPADPSVGGSVGCSPQAQARIATELERVVRRWQQLPLDRALLAVPAVRSLVQQLADNVADTRGMPHHQVPDLGPAVLMDQVRVMVFDYLEAARSIDLEVEELACAMVQLRRGLP